jgi:hypothetical protein
LIKELSSSIDQKSVAQVRSNDRDDFRYQEIENLQRWHVALALQPARIKGENAKVDDREVQCPTFRLQVRQQQAKACTLNQRVVGQFGLLYQLLIGTAGGGTRSDLISTMASARWSSSTKMIP